MMRLGFFQPLLLWALALCAIPVILHLLFRERTTSMLFSSLRFFRQTAVRASRRRKLQRILLLIVRILIVATAAMVFAQPFDASSPFSILRDPHLQAHVWVDRTASMDYRKQQRSLVRRSLDLIDSLRQSLAPAARVYLYDERQAAFVRYSPQIAGRIASICHGPSTIEEALNAFRRIRSARQLLVILSDFQNSPETQGVSTAQAIERFASRNGEQTPVCCVSLAPRDPWNYGITSARIAPENPGMLLVETSARRKRLNSSALVAQQAGMRVGRADIALAKNASATVCIPITLRDFGGMAGVVTLQTEDPFLLDNTCSFALPFTRPRRVLIVGESGRCAPLVAAFRSLDATAWGPVRSADYQTATNSDLDSADLLVLNAVPQATLALHQVISGGGYRDKAVIFALATDSLQQDFNRAVFARILKSDGPRLRRMAVARTVVLSDTVSALWAGFPRLIDADVAINAYCALSGGDALARIDNNDIFAMDVSRAEDGSRWIFVACELGLSMDNNLCESGFYVPLLDRLGRRALSRFAATTEWFAGVSAPNPHYGAGSSADVYNADRRFVARWERQPRVVFDTPGGYQIKPRDAPSYWVAVNVDTAECNFTYRLPEVKNSRSFMVTDEEGFLRLIQQTNHGSISQTLWIILALLTLAEMLLWLPSIGAIRGAKNI